jgi:hypothetical protein
VQRILKEQGVKAVQAFADGAPLAQVPRDAPAPKRKDGEAVEIDASEADDGDDPSSAPVAVETDADAAYPRAAREADPREDAGTVPALDAAARERLQAALDDLVACHAVLDQVLKEHPGKPLPD